jgi:DNA repair protein RAD5
MKFLQHEPWCLSSFWNTAITQTANNNNIDKATSDPTSREKSLQTAIDRIRRLLSPIMIRRTKDSLTKDGLPILTLPPIESKIVKVNLSDSEREFYNAVLARSLEVFDGFIKDGTAAKAYFQIFSLLSRLRQSCDHIALTVKSKIGDDEWMSSTIDVEDIKLDAEAKASAKSTDAINNQFLNNLLKNFYDQQGTNVQDSKRNGCDGPTTSTKRMKAHTYISSLAKNLSQAIEDNATHMDDECPICLDRPKIESAVLTPCGHIFCRHCLVGAIRSQSPPLDKNKKPENRLDGLDSTCPTCQEKFRSKRIIGLSDSLDELNAGDSSQKQSQTEPSIRDNPFVIARQILKNAVSGTESSKMKAIMDELNEIWKMDPGSKVLMFSHYLGFLDLLGAQFKAKGIPYFRLDGSLNIRERMHVLDEFRTSATPKATRESSIQKGTVLLMSMSAGGEGLNIVSASSCFILEPW